MKIITNQVKTVRVSKTSFKEWVLYGAVDQALKTSCQADAVKAVPLRIHVHGEPVEVEMWLNAAAANRRDDELNPPAQAILEQHELDKIGVNRTEAVLAGRDLPDLPLVKGIVILTGPGCSEFPQEHVQCTLASLVGQRPEEAAADDEEGP